MGISNLKGSSGTLDALAEKATFLFSTSTTTTADFLYSYEFTPGWYQFTTAPVAPADTNVYFYFLDSSDNVVQVANVSVDGINDSAFYLASNASQVLVSGATAGMAISCLSWDLETQPAVTTSGEQFVPSNTAFTTVTYVPYPGYGVVYNGVVYGPTPNYNPAIAQVDLTTGTGGYNLPLSGTSLASTIASNGAGTFVVASNSNATTGGAYSTDSAATWTSLTSYGPYSSSYTSSPGGLSQVIQLAYGNSVWVAAGYGYINNIADAKPFTFTSTLAAGTAWTRCTALSATMYATSVAFGNGYFVSTLSATGKYAYSTTGNTWTEGTFSGGYYSASNRGLRFDSVLGHYAELTDGTNYKVVKSTDGGATWSDVFSSTTYRYFAYDAFNSKWISKRISDGAYAYSSDAGSTWTVIPGLSIGAQVQVVNNGTDYYFIHSNSSTTVYRPIAGSFTV